MKYPRNWQLPTHRITELQPKKKAYCVIIPVINEGQKIQTQLHRMNKLGLSNSVDIIIADGGSTDDSLSLSFLKKQCVSVLLTKTGPGKLSAQLRMAYAYALQRGYRGIITVDGNGKDSVESIPLFIQKLQEGYGLVQGSRFIPGGKAVRTPLSRYLAIRLLHAPVISLAAKFWYTDTTNGYRGYSRDFLLDSRVQPFRDLFVTYELLAYLSARGPQLGYKTVEIPVTRSYPPTGKTPTKIHGWQAYTNLLQILWHLLLGEYNPRSET